MRLLDGRTLKALGNDHYHGLAFAWIFLLAHAAMNFFRGSIHTFKSDGGAASIAGIDLSQNAEVILSLFAGMGIGQLMMGAVDLAVALRFRALAPVLTGYYLIHQIGIAIALWWWRPMPVEAPGKYGAALLVPVVALAFWCATRRREAESPSPAAVAQPG